VLEILLVLFVFATWSLPAFMPALENIRSTPARREAGRPTNWRAILARTGRPSF